MHPAMEQLKELPVSERLELVQELWNSIEQDADVLPLQEWQRQIARDRLAEIKGKEADRGLSRQDVWDQVAQQRGS